MFKMGAHTLTSARMGIVDTWLYNMPPELVLSSLPCQDNAAAVHWQLYCQVRSGYR